MKVLQVNCLYKNGSTGKIVADIHSELLRRGVESVVCYGRGAKVHEPNVYKTCPEWYSKFCNFLSRFTGLRYGGCFFSTLYLLHIIKRERPDIVHLHCINGYFVNIFRLVSFLRKKQFKTVLTLHAEFMHTANCGYALDCEKWKIGCGACPRYKEETKSLFFDRTADSWRKMKKAFDGFSRLSVISVSPWLMARAKQSPILCGGNHFTILNGVDTNVFKQQDKFALRRKYGLPEKKIVFHATAYFTTSPGDLKGGEFVLQLARKLPDVEFYVAGTPYVHEQLPSNIHLLGCISNQNALADYYAMADVSLIVSKRETFSMPVAESLCCGTPIVGFKAGGPESICPESMKANFCKFGDVDSLADILNSQSSISDLNDCTQYYSKKLMTDLYLKVYEEL